MCTLNSKNKKGITLVEVLFSAVILALVFVAMLGIFVQTIDISKRINYEYTATNLAKNHLERAYTMIGTGAFGSLSDLSETDQLLNDRGGSDAGTNLDYKRSTTVTVLDAYTTEIEVSVTYKYRGAWRESAPVVITTVFTSIQ